MKKKRVSAVIAPTLWGRIAHLGPWWSGRALVPVLMVLALLDAPSAHAQPPAPVLQRGYDAGVSGATLSEATLNTSNVVPGTFGLVFKLPVDDNIMAQPLYVPGLVINGVAHNVLYVATMSDTLYAFDADVGGAPLWTLNLAKLVGAMPVPIAQFVYQGNKNIINNLGILSTPVIDLSTKTLYAVACTLENNTLVYRLHVVDITTGVPRTGSGVVISGNYGGTVTFDARNQWQRVSLVLSGGNVVFAFGALEQESSANLYSGWVMAYNYNASTGTLTQTGLFATETVGNSGGGVWQSGRPPAVDNAGNVYVISGNAYNDTSSEHGVANFGESVLKLNPAQGLHPVVDWFSPSNWSTLDSQDLDLTSSGPMLVPNTNLLVGGGKTGILYVLNTTNLGNGASDHSGYVQAIQIFTNELRGGPVYWQRSAANGGPLLYNWGVSDALKAFAFNGSTFATTPSAQSNVNPPIVFPGGILTLSANGETAGSGVVWATAATSGDAENNPPVPGALYAFDAGNVAKELWDSNMNAARDSFGNFAKFVPPAVANGRVYVATWSNQVAVYGLLAPAPILTAISPTSGPTAGGTAVTLTGQNFASGAKVTFGGAAATNVVVSATQITASTPPHAQGAVNVTVTNPDGQSATSATGFTFVAPAPAVTGVAPTSGTTAGGTAVTLTGANFTSGAMVAFGGAAATNVVVVSATQITANTPPHAQGAVNVTVTNPDGQSGTLASGFTFVAGGPTVSSVSPTTGLTAGGTHVTLTGNNFVSGATVTFGGAPATAVVVVNATQITANTPPHKPGGVNIVVTNPGGQSGTLVSGFTYHKH